MMLRRHRAGWIIGAVTLMAGLPAQGDDGFRPLGAREIRAQLVGKEITDGPHWSMFLRPDGVLISAEAGSSWSGKWTIRDNKLCMSNPALATLDCNDVWTSGQRVRMRAGQDDQGLEGMIRPHRAD